MIDRMSGKVSTLEVPRGYTLSTEEYREHLRAVGRSIIAAADHIDIDAKYLSAIDITATIAPATEVTKVYIGCVINADVRSNNGN